MDVTPATSPTSSPTSSPPDTTRPTVPTTLTARAVSASQINLSWTASTDNVAVTGYKVYRDGSLLATLGVVTTYQNSGLTPSTLYTYTVSAIDGAGNESLQSTTANAMTSTSSLDPTPPTIPTNLTATAVPASQINLSWTASTDNVAVTGYKVYRDGSLLTILGIVTTYQDSGLTPSTLYTYTVSALDGAGNESAQSVAASATTQAVSAVISISLIPSRTSGVAPLAVFFDATGTTSPLTTRPFHDIEYRWDFGDPTSGTWSRGSTAGVSSKNSATDAVAAHVFETPGTYPVTLTAFDGTNTDAQTVQITVSGWDGATNGNTLYVGNTLPVKGLGGVPNDPYSFVLASSDFGAVINTTAGGGKTYKRILFNRGDTFNVNGIPSIMFNGPGIIGAYGSGAKPIVRNAGINEMFEPGNKATPNVKDWRVMDLAFDGARSASASAIWNEAGIRQWLFLRLDIYDVHVGFDIEESRPQALNTGIYKGQLVNDEIAVVDSTCLNILPSLPALNNGGYCSYFASQRLMFLGNSMDNNRGGEHTVRHPYVGKGVISNNTMLRASNATGGKHEFTLRAPGWTLSNAIYALNTATQYVVVSDNKFVGDTQIWTATTGAQNDTSNEHVEDTIWERNWFTSGPGTGRALKLEASNQTVRNNLFDMTGGTGHEGIAVTYANTAGLPPPNLIYILNNTFYSADTDNDFHAVSLASTVTNATVENNLAYAPHDSTHNLLQGTGASGLVASHNSSDAQIGGFSASPPGWVSVTPSVPANFELTAGSYAIDAGAAIPVFSDFFRKSRPQNVVIDLGAMEF